MTELLGFLVKASYFVAALLFLLGLQRMSTPKTARSGIQWAGAGMLIAVLAMKFFRHRYRQRRAMRRSAAQARTAAGH